MVSPSQPQVRGTHLRLGGRGLDPQGPVVRGGGHGHRARVTTRPPNHSTAPPSTARNRAWTHGNRVPTGAGREHGPVSETVIVVVEDDPNIADLVDLYLRQDGFRVYQAATGERALEVISSRRPRLVVLDLGLPGDLDGIEVCRRVQAETDCAVLMLTARDDEADRVSGFEVGADDYVTKPFSPRELVARVRAILRRLDGPPPERPPVVRVGAVEIDTGRREVRVGGQIVSLATREHDLLEYLGNNAGMALTRRQLLDGVWGPDWEGDERTVDVHVRQLRRKLGEALPLDTVWGVGYRLG